MDTIKEGLLKLAEEHEGGGLILFCMLSMMLAHCGQEAENDGLGE